MSYRRDIRTVDAPLDYSSQYRHRYRSDLTSSSQHYGRPNSDSYGLHRESKDRPGTSNFRPVPQPLESADRYVRSMEMEIERLQADLEEARHEARNPALMQDLRACQDQLRQAEHQNAILEKDILRMQNIEENFDRQRDDLERTTKELQDASRANLDLQREMNRVNEQLQSVESRSSSMHDRLEGANQDIRRLQDENHRLQQENLELQRQVTKSRDQQSLETNRRVSELQSEVTSLRQQLRGRESDIRSRDQSLEHVQLQLRQEEEKYREYQHAQDRALSDLRGEKDRLEADYRQITTENDSLRQQRTRLEDQIQQLEDEKAQIRDRVQQLEAGNDSLRADNADIDQRLSESLDRGVELEKQLDKIKEHLKNSESLRKEAEERENRMKDMYFEIGDLFGSTESQKQAGLVLTSAREVMDRNARLQQEIYDVRKQNDELAKEVDFKQQRIDQLQRDLSRNKSSHYKLDDELGGAREELLMRTRELKEMTLTQESHLHDIRVLEERCYKLEEEIMGRDRTIKSLEDRLDDQIRNGEMRHADLETSLTRLEADRAREITRLQDALARSEEEARNARPYLELGTELGRILLVDNDTTSTVHAVNIRTAVETMLKKANEAPIVVSRPATAVQQPVFMNTQSSSFHDESKLRELETTKADLRENESRWIQLRLQFDEFRRSVAKVIHSRAEDSSGILADLRDYSRKHHQHNGERKSRLGHDRSDYHHDDRLLQTAVRDEKELRRVKERLDTAMKTIASQDIWINVLNKKLEELDGSGRRLLHAELQRLESQVVGLKSKLFGGQIPQTNADILDLSGPVPQSRHGTSHMSTSMSSTGHVVDISDITNFKNTIAKLEASLRKHREFKQRIIRALGMKMVAMPDDRIVETITDLVRKSNRQDRLSVR